MISISTYRRYAQRSGGFYRAGMGPKRDPQPKKGPQQPAHHQPPPPPRRPQAAPAPPPPSNQGLLSELLPAGLDTGDLFLAAMLLFLYAESKDEDFLIILIVVGLSIFRKDGD